MEEYLIKSSAGIAIGYTLYRFLLRNSTSFKWLRIYFLSTVAASFLLPLVERFFMYRQKTWVQIPSEYIAAFLSSSDVSLNKQFSVNTSLDSYTGSELVFYFYLFGVSVFLARFLFGFIQLVVLSIKNGVQKVGNDRLVFVHNLPYPFSFLHLIFINRQTLSEYGSGAMLKHERVHIRQWHWLDLILLELLVAFQWFNPMAWFFRRSVKELHEFLADEGALKHQSSALEYQLLLFNQVCGTKLFQPVNGFQSSLTKKRIFMINNKRNKKWFAAFAAIVLAIFAIQSLSRINFAQDPPGKNKQDKQANITTNKADTASWKYPPPPPPPPPPSLPQDFTTNMPAPPPPPPPPPFPFFSGTSDFNKSNEAFGDYITKNIQLSSTFTDQKNNGVFVIVTFDNNGNITNAEKGFTPKGFSTGYKIKFTEDPQIVNEVIKVIKNAPKFNVDNFVEGSLLQVNYGIIFRDKGCKVLPVHFVYNDVIDSPVNKPLDPAQLK